LFSQVLRLCARAGLGRAGIVAVDSTKLHADASSRQSFDYERIAREIIAEGIASDAAEDEIYGDARGDELPPELADPATRRERLKQAKRELEAEWEAEKRAREEMLERRAEHEARTGRRPMGRPPHERDLSGPPPGQVNLTDPESKPMRTAKGFIQGYNAHAVATEDQIIVAVELSNRSGDGGMLEPMITAAREQLAAAELSMPVRVLADAGYWSSEQIQALSEHGMTVLVPPDGHARTGAPKRNTRGALAARMRETLRAETGRALYQQRQQIIEPVFGHTKHNRGFARFRRRGLTACLAEWQLIAATHNLQKLWRAKCLAAA